MPNPLSTWPGLYRALIPSSHCVCNWVSGGQILLSSSCVEFSGSPHWWRRCVWYSSGRRAPGLELWVKSGHHLVRAGWSHRVLSSCVFPKGLKLQTSREFRVLEEGLVLGERKINFCVQLPLVYRFCHLATPLCLTCFRPGTAPALRRQPLSNMVV